MRVPPFSTCRVFSPPTGVLHFVLQGRLLTSHPRYTSCQKFCFSREHFSFPLDCQFKVVPRGPSRSMYEFVSTHFLPFSSHEVEFSSPPFLLTRRASFFSDRAKHTSLLKRVRFAFPPPFFDLSQTTLFFFFPPHRPTPFFSRKTMLLARVHLSFPPFFFLLAESMVFFHRDLLLFLLEKNFPLN